MYKLSLSLENIEFKYTNNSNFVLSVPQLYVNFDRPLGIYGLAGSGKSSLGKLLAGLITPLKGKIIFSCKQDGSNFNCSPSIVYTPQFAERIFLGSTVDETLNYLLKARSQPELFYSSFNDYLKIFDLSFNKIRFKNAHQMSAGELRRFVLALCLAGEPDVLILDEPTIGLGDEGREILSEIVLNFASRKVLILISHDFELIKTLCVKICIMDNGTVIFSGIIDSIKDSIFDFDKVGLDLFVQLSVMVKHRNTEILAGQNHERDKC